jgi:hypothetical protein
MINLSTRGAAFKEGQLRRKNKKLGILNVNFLLFKFWQISAGLNSSDYLHIASPGNMT